MLTAAQEATLRADVLRAVTAAGRPALVAALIADLAVTLAARVVTAEAPDGNADGNPADPPTPAEARELAALGVAAETIKACTGAGLSVADIRRLSKGSTRASINASLGQHAQAAALQTVSLAHYRRSATR